MRFEPELDSTSSLADSSSGFQILPVGHLQYHVCSDEKLSRQHLVGEKVNVSSSGVYVQVRVLPVLSTSQLATRHHL